MVVAPINIPDFGSPGALNVARTATVLVQRVTAHPYSGLPGAPLGFGVHSMFLDLITLEILGNRVAIERSLLHCSKVSSSSPAAAEYKPLKGLKTLLCSSLGS
jgi:hypothetical protein